MLEMDHIFATNIILSPFGAHKNSRFALIFRAHSFNFQFHGFVSYWTKCSHNFLILDFSTICIVLQIHNLRAQMKNVQPNKIYNVAYIQK